jgi:hypothetical protein
MIWRRDGVHDINYNHKKNKITKFEKRISARARALIFIFEIIKERKRNISI